MGTVRIAILGATGYAGEGAARILLGHPGFELVHCGSDRLHGTRLDQAVPALQGETSLVLQPDTSAAIIDSGAQAVVLAKKSPEITRIVPELLQRGLRLVDIGAEFRLRDHQAYRRWYGEEHACPELLPGAVYGLCEVHAGAIRTARLVGSPGCYATSILLPLIPLLRAGLLQAGQAPVAVSYSGLSGAGKRYSETNNNLFWSVNENLRAYKPFAHQHTGEIDQEASLAAGGSVHVGFIPHLAPITRGILSTITARLSSGVGLDQVRACWDAAYRGRRFVRVRGSLSEVEVANVVGSNFLDCAAAVDGTTLAIASTLDNLVKGASGQAVQSLNLMFGLDETAGLLHRSL